MTGPTVHVVLVRPQTPGNVGAVARACWNFDVHDLHVVGGIPDGDAVEERARDAIALVEDAHVHETLDDAADTLDLLAGFTARTSLNPKRHTREAVELTDFAEEAGGTAGDVGLVFGPEDHGLSNEAILACDVPVTIATSDAYPSMNLSHAVAVALHAVAGGGYDPPADEVRPLDGDSKARLHEAFDALLDALDLEDRRRDHTSTAWRRVMGRALPSKWEYHRLMGVLTVAAERLGADADRWDAAPDRDDEDDDGAG